MCSSLSAQVQVKCLDSSTRALQAGWFDGKCGLLLFVRRLACPSRTQRNSFMIVAVVPMHIVRLLFSIGSNSLLPPLSKATPTTPPPSEGLPSYCLNSLAFPDFVFVVSCSFRDTCTCACVCMCVCACAYRCYAPVCAETFAHLCCVYQCTECWWMCLYGCVS